MQRQVRNFANSPIAEIQVAHRRDELPSTASSDADVRAGEEAAEVTHGECHWSADSYGILHVPCDAVFVAAQTRLVLVEQTDTGRSDGPV